MRLRACLALIFTAALLPLIVFSAISLNLLRDAERKSALENLHETARFAALTIDRELGSAEAGLRVLAGSPLLMQNDLPGFYRQAAGLSLGADSWTMLVDRDGKQLVNTRVALGTAVPPESVDAAHRIADVMQSQGTQVSNLIVGPLTDRYRTTISVPVLFGDARQYVLSQAFAAEHFTRVLSQMRMPASWTVSILDREGNVIARNKNAGILVGRPASPDVISAIKGMTNDNLRHVMIEGVDSYSVHSRSEKSGWSVLVAAPASVIESTAFHAVQVAALGLLAALFAAAATAVLASRRLVQSIRHVGESASALTRGELPIAKTSAVSELNTLSAALASAAVTLQQERALRHEAEAERARLLENEQLARQQIEKQNTAKDQFLAMLGHELRNPLSAISGAIAVMKARDASAALNTRAHTIIERQSNHLSHIVDDLLDLSRMSMGKIKLTRQPVDLAAVVHASVDTLYAAGRVGECDIGIEAEPVWIDADRTRLDQIIGNVLSNALKFSSMRGRIDITVACDATEAIWTVRDYGIGISEELMPNIFDAFVHGVAQEDHALGGLGIGLNLVRQLVQLHQGTISISSDGSGAGTTVVVRFPLSKSISVPVVTVPAPAAVSVQPPSSSTVLLIEDNADSREMMAMLLGMLGYPVLEAPNGNEGLRVAQREQPAIAVVDIGLPDLDGYEVARQLRADPQLRGMTLIALTGYGQDADRKRALAAGFDSHLVKPLDMDVLVKTIILHQAKQKTHPHDAGNQA